MEDDEVGTSSQTSQPEKKPFNRQEYMRNYMRTYMKNRTKNEKMKKANDTGINVKRNRYINSFN